MSDDLETEYTELNSSILIESAGIRAGATIADINGDLKFDCLIGIQNGGMLCYLGNDSIDDIFEANQVQSEIQLFPNPGNNELNWLSGSYMESITAFNTRGQILFSEEVNFDKGRIDTRGTGILACIYSGNKNGKPA